MANLRHIYRLKSSGRRGWKVVLRRRNRRHTAYFYDGTNRGRSMALARAVGYRDAALKVLPPPRKFQSLGIRNTSGTVGVHLARIRKPNGHVHRRYVATWYDEQHRPKRKSFSIAKYGKQGARLLAEQTRAEAVSRQTQPERQGPLPPLRSRRRK